MIHVIKSRNKFYRANIVISLQVACTKKVSSIISAFPKNNATLLFKILSYEKIEGKRGNKWFDERSHAMLRDWTLQYHLLYSVMATAQTSQYMLKICAKGIKYIDLSITIDCAHQYNVLVFKIGCLFLNKKTKKEFQNMFSVLIQHPI